MKRALTILFLSAMPLVLAAQDSIQRKSYHATRITTAPHIDGDLSDAAWASAEVASDFVQNSPTSNGPVIQKTEFRILYDNTALYIGAKMYDNHPDSIMQQLGVRDEYLTADQFRFVFDTYNTQQDAYDFSVYASGVQSDSRFSDPNYDAVWRSAVKIVSDGWICEVAIPYSAIRFPTSDKQTWGLQVTRNYNRPKYSEFDQWALTPKDKPNPLQYWGKIEGIEKIEAPVRLSLTPYFTTNFENDGTTEGHPKSTSFSGGLDLKYGLNESFTLDATLLPDFSQVQSDNIVKNLSAFEVQYNENRPFFTEGVDLFQRGNLFYSRRIGRTPGLFYDVPDMLNPSEHLIKNPSQSKLLNATKVSGRTNNGMGIGLLNAIIDNTYAVAEDTATGAQRKILTEPRSNYNIFVIDKQMKHSSSVYLINTSVIRSQGYNHANVTGTGINLNNKKNTLNFTASGAVSNLLTPDTIKGQFYSTLGSKYYLSLSKTSGKVQFGINRSALSANFDDNDLGIVFERNISGNSAWVSYQEVEPKGIFLYSNLNYNLNYNENLSTHSVSNLNTNVNGYGQFRNFTSAYFGVSANLLDGRDYYEPRTDGRYYLRTRNYDFWSGYNGNSNKKYYINLNFYGGTTAKVSPTIPANPWIGGSINNSWRANDRLTLSLSLYMHNDIGDRGWVNTEDDGTIVFGRRIIRNFDNSLQASYIFMRDMSISLNARHYWSTGRYTGYYKLEDDGTLTDYVTYPLNHDFSFNYFSINMVYKWVFAPGSTLSVVWKQQIQTEETVINYDYMHDFKGTITAPQLNSVSVRVLYYLDYLYLKKLREKHKH